MTNPPIRCDARFLLRIPIIIRLIGWIFAHMSFLIPVTRLRETSNLIAFQHPSPSYKFHVLIMPKREVASLAQLDPADTAFLTDLYSTVQSLVDEFHLQAYRLIVNGGEYQDFPHLHFHLISPSPLAPLPEGEGQGVKD
jgi:histidine triad (HIT) family protein